MKPVSEAEAEFSGIWVSEGGSHYTFDGSRFVCISVHSHAFRGWEGKIAVDDVHRIDLNYAGLQAFRCKSTGAISNWVPIDLVFEKNVVTKFFPRNVSKGLLVYGHVERYYRVSANLWH